MYRSVPTTAADLTVSGDLLVLEAQFESRGHFGTLAVTCRPNHTTLRQRYGVLVSALLRWFVLNRAVRETSGALRVNRHPPLLSRQSGFVDLAWEQLPIPDPSILWVKGYRARLEGGDAEREFVAYQLIALPLDSDVPEHAKQRLHSRARRDAKRVWPVEGPKPSDRGVVVLSRLGATLALQLAEVLAEYWVYSILKTEPEG